MATFAHQKAAICVGIFFGYVRLASQEASWATKARWSWQRAILPMCREGINWKDLTGSGRGSMVIEQANHYEVRKRDEWLAANWSGRVRVSIYVLYGVGSIEVYTCEMWKLK